MSWVNALLFINIAIYLLQLIVLSYWQVNLTEFFGLNPRKVVADFYLWQPISYMFLHSVAMKLHIIFNMYLLWIFGVPIEEEWGSKTFLRYYLFAGIGAGATILITNLIVAPYSYTIGASGAIFALLLAFGLIYPDNELLLFFVLPIKAKYLVVLYGGIELFLMISAPGSQVSHIGHLGGLLFGLLFFILFKREYLPGRKRRPKQTKEMLDEIRNKVEEIRDKTKQYSRDEYIKRGENIKTQLKEKTIEELSQEEIDFLTKLKESVPQEEWGNICKKIDFDVEDSFCRNCEYFNLCLYRDITGDDVREKTEE
jgi:membrane associated rhomboid family serine protease